MMVIGMKFYKSYKKTAYLLSALLLIACQPPAPSDERLSTSANSEIIDTPLIISADSVTMTPDHILSIKPSRYQPSLGLQGNIEPVKQTQLTAARSLVIEQVLVTKGQWVEKGSPLLIVRHQTDSSKQTVKPNETNAKNSDSANASTITLNNGATTSEPTAPLLKDKQDSNSKEKNINNNKSTNLKSDLNTPNAKPSDSESKANNNPSITINSDMKGEVINRPALSSANNSDSAIATKPKSVGSENLSQPIIIRASFSGRIDSLYIEPGQEIDARKPLLILSDETDLRFIATLPIQAEPQLSVGQTVNFTTRGLVEKFTGQVSNLLASNEPGKLLVYVHVIKNDASRNTLKPDMLVTGRVNYGQIEVGTIVPKQALHDVDLTTLQTPPYQSIMPLTANVWIIRQDQRLTRQPVEVIEYDPSTGQYLIAGISNDSLICLAELPIESAGKKVIIS